MIRQYFLAAVIGVSALGDESVEDLKKEVARLKQVVTEFHTERGKAAALLSDAGKTLREVNVRLEVLEKENAALKKELKESGAVDRSAAQAAVIREVGMRLCEAGGPEYNYTLALRGVNEWAGENEIRVASIKRLRTWLENAAQHQIIEAAEMIQRVFNENVKAEEAKKVDPCKMASKSPKWVVTTYNNSFGIVDSVGCFVHWDGRVLEGRQEGERFVVVLDCDGITVVATWDRVARSVARQLRVNHIVRLDGKITAILKNAKDQTMVKVESATITRTP